MSSKFRKKIAAIRQKLLRYRRWSTIWLAGTPNSDQIQVSYGHKQIPGPGEAARGGMVKFQRIQHLFPNAPRRFNVLYLGSSSLPSDWAQQVWLAQRKGACIVVNQNGVAYPGWHGPGWERVNQPMSKLIHTADYVFYQSRFCKLSADRFLGDRSGPGEILYNSVDTQFFTPAKTDLNPSPLVLLLGGNQYQFYRLESALQAVAIMAGGRTDVRLLVAGRLNWIPDQARAKRIARHLSQELGIDDRVEFLGPYTQAEAPKIYRQAHILLHPKYNDPCSSTVIEAMACGLPVVYSRSGGTPELVGDEAGVGVPTALNWEQDLPPDPPALAEAVLHIAENRAPYAEAARQRAVEHFDLRPWLQRHREVFERLTMKTGSPIFDSEAT
jgi:glycosyltransferase involved in cell wall biosynthesis